MKKSRPEIPLSQKEIHKLKTRLEELEQVLKSIQSGEVDSLVIHNKEGEAEVFTLEGGGQPYRILVESLLEGTATLTKAGKFLHCNKKFSDLLNLPVEAIIGSYVFEYIPEAQHATLSSLLHTEKFEDVKGEFKLLAADETFKTVIFSFHNLKFGEIDGVSILVTDISTLKIELEKRLHAQKELTENEDLFRQFAENIKEVFWRFTPELDRLIYVSPAYEEIWGRPRDNLYSNPYEWLDSVYEPDRKKALAFIEKLRTHESASCEYNIICPDGKTKIIYAKGFQLKDRDGKLLNVTGIASDMTELIQIKQQAHLDDKLKTIGTLAASIMHEINNPLAWIFGNLEYIKKKCATLDRAKLEEIVDESLTGTKQIRDIVGNLKGFSRTDDNELSFIDLEDLLNTVLKIAASEVKHHALIQTQYAQDLPLFQGSAGKLQQVFLNLIMNSLQAIPEGDVENQAIYLSTKLENKYIRVDVRDTGCGIDEEKLAKIFEPFFTTKPRGIGTGLGLSITHEILTSVGGKITVISSPGKGTTFTVYLPIPALS